METATDNQVMERVQRGEVARLSVLFDRYHKPLFRYFMHLCGDRTLSEDLVQDVFFRILKFRQTFQREHSFRSWIYQVARNAHLDYRRKKREEVGLPLSPEGEVLDLLSKDIGPDETYRKRQEAALLERALAAMPVEKRELLILSRFQELRYDEIAAITHCDVGTVKVRIHRALKDLGGRFHALMREQAS